MSKFTFSTSQDLPEEFVEEYDVQSPEAFRLLALLFLESAHWHYGMWQTFGGIKSVQFPMDYYTFRRVVEKAKPDVIIETGSAFGGTTLFLASLLYNLGKSGPVYSVGIDLTVSISAEESRVSAAKISQNRWGIPLQFIQGSSTDPDIIRQLREFIPLEARILVILDSDHSRNHVLEELRMYAGFVSLGSYMIVCDTHCHIISDEFKKERSWDMAADPYSAVQDFLIYRTEFCNDKSIDNFPLTTMSGGILLRSKL